MNQLKLKYYRWRLKHAYLRYRALVGDFSCGSALAEHISLRVADAKAACNHWIAKINAIAPATLKPL